MIVYHRERIGDIREVIMEKYFLGAQAGVGLKRRGPDDPHVLIQLLSEDDGFWHVGTDALSSFWIRDLQEILLEAKDWMEKNCDPDINDGIQFGWKFRP